MKKILISVSLFLCAAVPISAAFGHEKATSIDIEKVSQEQRKVSVVVNDKNGPVIGKFPILGCHLLDGCLLAPV